MSSLSSGRALRVETDPFPPRSLAKKTASTSSLGFMKSTASSVSKVVSGSPMNAASDAIVDREDAMDRLMSNVLKFTRSRYVL